MQSIIYIYQDPYLFFHLEWTKNMKIELTYYLLSLSLLALLPNYP